VSVSAKFFTEITLAGQGMLYGDALFRLLADHINPFEEPL